MEREIYTNYNDWYSRAFFSIENLIKKYQGVIVKEPIPANGRTDGKIIFSYQLPDDIEVRVSNVAGGDADLDPYHTQVMLVGEDAGAMKKYEMKLRKFLNLGSL